LHNSYQYNSIEKPQTNLSRNLDIFRSKAIINFNWCDEETWNRMDTSNSKYKKNELKKNKLKM